MAEAPQSEAEKRQRIAVALVAVILLAGVGYLFVTEDIMVFCIAVFASLLIFLTFGAQRRELPPMTPEEAEKKKQYDRSITFMIVLIVIIGGAASLIMGDTTFVWIALLASLIIFVVFRGSELKKRRG